MFASFSFPSLFVDFDDRSDGCSIKLVKKQSRIVAHFAVAKCALEGHGLVGFLRRQACGFDIEAPGCFKSGIFERCTSQQ